MRALVILFAAACAAPKPAAPPELPAPRNPSVVTRALLREIARGQRPLESFIDPERGLVYLDVFQSPADEVYAPDERQLCGAELVRELPRLQHMIAEGVRATERDGGELHCHNKPLPLCGYGATMEWDPSTNLVFRVDPERGVMLTAITIYDSVLVIEEDSTKTQRYLDKRLAELTSVPCP